MFITFIFSIISPFRNEKDNSKEILAQNIKNRYFITLFTSIFYNYNRFTPKKRKGPTTTFCRGFLSKPK